MAVAGGLKPPTPGAISCEDGVNAALEKAFLPRDMFTIYFAPLVINTAGKLVVLDTGNGPVANVNSKGANGQFGANMVYGPSPMRNRIGE